MSFALTTIAVLRREKDVTRRLGWLGLKPGDRLYAVKKGQGLKKGEKVEILCVIEVVSNTREPLAKIRDYPATETAREGFPQWDADRFIAMFCEANKCSETTTVNRIEFKYL